METGGGLLGMVGKGGGFLGMVGKGGGGGGEEGEERRGNGSCEETEGICLAPQKLARTDAFPFRMPPFSRGHNGPTFYNNSSNNSEGRLNDSYDVPAAAMRSLQPFTVAFKSQEMASLRFPFTAAQWQELEQQALIFKHMVASVPVPPELLLPIRRNVAHAAASIANNTSAPCNLSWSGLNVLRSSSSSTDPEPGRCRRTDGKKWRCSRDVAPDQRYCERHMHRGRPRSRKPVEVQQQRSNSNNAAPPPSTLSRSVGPLTQPPPCSLSSSSSQELIPKPIQSSGFRLPSQATIASSLTDNTSRYMNWMRGEMDGGIVSTGRDSSAAIHQWELLQSKFGEMQELRLSTSNTHSLTVHDNLSFLPDTALQRDALREGDGNSILAANYLNGLESTTENQPRRFIDAWSIENRWPHTTATRKSSASKLSPSHLSLSMSGGAGSTVDEIDQIQMGISVNDTENNGALTGQQSSSWMLPVSWQASSPLGGPLAEVLQSSSGPPAAAPNSPKGSNNKTSPRGFNLMTDGWGGQGSPRMVPSPTGVLQKTLAFHSDSSGGCSPPFGAKPEIALQWLNQQEPPKLPS